MNLQWHEQEPASVRMARVVPQTDRFAENICMHMQASIRSSTCYRRQILILFRNSCLMDYDNTLLALYGTALVVIIILLSDLWAMAGLFIFVLMISLLQKIHLEDRIEEEIAGRKRNAELLLSRVDAIVKRIEEARYEISKSFFAVESRLEDVRSDSLKEMDMNYRELARKIAELEARLDTAKRTYSAALASFDERIQAAEDE